jgi:hypothetical protein
VVEKPEVSPNLCIPGRAPVAQAVASLTGKELGTVADRVVVLRCHGTSAFARDEAEYAPDGDVQLTRLQPCVEHARDHGQRRVEQLEALRAKAIRLRRPSIIRLIADSSSRTALDGARRAVSLHERDDAPPATWKASTPFPGRRGKSRRRRRSRQFDSERRRRHGTQRRRREQPAAKLRIHGSALVRRWQREGGAQTTDGSGLDDHEHLFDASAEQRTPRTRSARC